MINLIVAYDNDRAIGRQGDLLWKPGEMSGDMKRFRDITMNNSVIMGRKTLKSIGVALPRRQNIVVTHFEAIDSHNVEIAHSLDEAYNLSKQQETFVIGGEEIYRQALERVQRIYATEVDAKFEDADTYFPSLNQGWEKTEEESFESDSKNIYPYKFVTYERV